MIRSEFEVREVIVTMMGPVIGTHVGPGCVALFFEADMNRETYEKEFYPAK
jgi:fatty acid-binding protein DegV